MDVHKLASLMVRDLTIIAKRQHDVARDYRAMASTWRQLLDDTVLPVLKELSTQEDGMLGAPVPLPGQEPFVFVDAKGEEIS